MNLTQEDVQAVARATAEFILVAEKPVAVSLAQAGAMLSCDSDSATCRTLRKLGVRPFMLGKYRRADIENAVARESYNAARRASAKGAAGKPFETDSARAAESH